MSFDYCLDKLPARWRKYPRAIGLYSAFIILHLVLQHRRVPGESRNLHYGLAALRQAQDSAPGRNDLRRPRQHFDRLSDRRLEMTGHAGDQSVTAQYELDNGRVLAATAGDLTTTYLSGLGPIAELTDALRQAQGTTWSYSLPDGSNTPRQLVNASAEVMLAASYTPWGDTLSVSGTGSFTHGYLGGVMDMATGLLYVGNGQYYDPETGRFLNRNAKPEQTNPYVPWGGEPGSAFIAPLALWAVFIEQHFLNLAAH